MSMLNNEELTLALINNLAEWDWDLFPKFRVDEQTAKALIKTYWSLRGKGNEICTDDNRHDEC